MTDEPCAFEMKLSRYIQLGAADQEGIERLKADPKRFKCDVELIEEGRPSSKVLLIHEGWARSYKLLQNGTRTIVSFPIAGDFIGIRSTLLARADDSTAAVTDLVVSEWLWSISLA